MSALAAALAKVQGELTSIPQTKTANAGTYSYKYADLADVVAVAYPLMSKHGLAYLARPTTNEAGHFVLAYSLLHEAGEREDGEYPLPASGTAQQLGAAITYARRYTFCAVIGVVSEEDTDGPGQDVQTTARPKQRRQGNGEPEAAAEAPPDQREELRGRMGWLIKQLGMPAEDALRVVSEHAGREITDSRVMSVEELLRVNEALEQMAAVSDFAAGSPVDTATGEVDQQITQKTQRRQRAQRKELGLEDDEPFWEWLEVQFGRPFTSSTQQTEAEALEACRRMQVMVDAARRHEEGAGNGDDDGS